MVYPLQFSATVLATVKSSEPLMTFLQLERTRNGFSKDYTCAMKCPFPVSTKYYKFYNYYYMTIFASGPEREIQQFDWFLSGLELAVPDR